MTAVVMVLLIVADYMLMHWLYDTAARLYKRGKRQLFLAAIQARVPGPESVGLEP